MPRDGQNAKISFYNAHDAHDAHHTHHAHNTVIQTNKIQSFVIKKIFYYLFYLFY